MGVLSSCSGGSDTSEDVKVKATVENNEKDLSKIEGSIKNSDTKSIAEKKFEEQIEKLENKQKEMKLISDIGDENLKSEYKNSLQKLQKLKWEKEILSEKFEFQQLKDEKIEYEEKKKYEDEKEKYKREKERYERSREKLKRIQAKQKEDLEHEASILEIKANKFKTKITLTESEREFNKNSIMSEISLLKMLKERDNFIIKKPAYLDNPLSADSKTLTISDRRIDINSEIYDEMADIISRQINYYNNKDNSKPIFIVIDKSPGGSIMAGYVIIKAMESSKAPIYVVLKSFAASMTSVIVTLADKSFVYPQALMIHHQPIAFQYGSYNLTQQQENFKHLEKWWTTFGGQVAKKMGISLDEFKKEMYAHSSSGDWVEFGTEAQKLKWVNHIIEHIEDHSVLVNPLYKENEGGEYEGEDEDEEEYEEKVQLSSSKKKSSMSHIQKNKKLRRLIGKDGKAFSYLPRLSPQDAYFIYNPDDYYRVR
jgi:ATP-dependent Clp protease protease subunit